MKKLAAITLAALILLSACGKSTPSLGAETTTEYSSEAETEAELNIRKEVGNMPEIVFARATQKIGEGISGNFITRNGGIYFWDFGEINFKKIDEFDNSVYEQLLDALNDNPKKSQAEIDEKDLINIYSKLVLVDINAVVNSWENPNEEYITQQDIYYGIRQNKTGEKEISLLGGWGWYIYENTDPNAKEIYVWLSNKFFTIN
ncbi:MAG: hypothetical protein FWG90_12405 [Oscillospiraceae bacterium]|nr:hypothetical protein [Oscillospiraceae bacterium]